MKPHRVLGNLSSYLKVVKLAIVQNHSRLDRVWASLSDNPVKGVVCLYLCLFVYQDQLFQKNWRKPSRPNNTKCMRVFHLFVFWVWNMTSPPLRRHNDARWKALKGLACLSPVPTGNPSILRRPLAKEQINSVCALERERPNPIIPFPGDTDQIVNSTPLSFTCVCNSFQKGHIDVLTPNREGLELKSLKV